MKTLALDIATHIGFAIVQAGAIIESGSVELASEAELVLQRKDGRERTLDVRFTRFCHFIKPKIAQGATRVVFEDVTFSRSTMQAQLWASLRAAIWMIAQDSNIEVFCVHTGTLKAFATGNGSADKAAMAEALARVEPANCTFEGATLLLKGRPVDDDEVDAIWLARYAMAVDSGEQRFLSAHDRECIRREEKRKKRIEIRAARKARRQAKKEEANARRHRLKEALKAAGRCCGVLRKLGPGYRAVCPKCGNSLPVRLKAITTSASAAESAVQA